jgi:hypothetical protein
MMKLVKQILHLISYLQYPAMLLALYYLIWPLLSGTELEWTDLNSALVFVGLGISLATLQDASKSGNKLFAYIREHPGDRKRIIFIMAAITLLILVLGLIGFFSIGNEPLHELYFGFFLLGVGLIGLLKSALDVLEIKDPK